MSSTVGTVAHLWRFPVKSMQGERLDEGALTDRGIVGDRAYGLVETQSGKVVSAKNVKAYPNLFACRAEYVAPPQVGKPAPPVRITFPDGSAVTSDAKDVDGKLSKFFGRGVTLAHTAPANFTIEEHQLDVERDAPGPTVDAQLGSALWTKLGAKSPVPADAFFDVFPLSMLTSATLEALNAARPHSRFDERRFRMNVIVRANGSGFVENDWVDRVIEIGATARVRVAMPDPRCVMTTLAQADLPRDIDVLRTLGAHNKRAIPGLGTLPCAGVYAQIDATGLVRAGDAVRLV